MQIPINEIINAGEAFVVQYSSDIDCFLFMMALLYRLQTDDVPPGKPDKRLLTYAYIVGFNDVEANNDMMISVIINKGNKDGITDE